MELKPTSSNSKRNKIIIAIIIALLLGIILFLALRPAQKEVQVVDTSNNNVRIDKRSSDEVPKGPLSDRQVYFSGINDADVSAKTVVYLENLPENDDFYMTYQIEDKETGEIVFETDLIPSGEHVEWVIGDSLSVGEHKLIFHEKPYWEDETGNWIALTSGNNEATFTVH